jgi:hypothetical protein
MIPGNAIGFSVAALVSPGSDKQELQRNYRTTVNGNTRERK